MNTKDLIDEVVSLPAEERVLVVDSLLRSLNQPGSELGKRWAEIAKRRLTLSFACAKLHTSTFDLYW